MKKTLSLLSLLFILTNCAETIALLGPVTSGASGGKVAQSAISSAISYGVKQQTGMTPTEHAMTFMEENNPDNKKEKCLSIIDYSNTKTCAAIKNSLAKTRQKILEKSKIENLAYKGLKYNRR